MPLHFSKKPEALYVPKLLMTKRGDGKYSLTTQCCDCWPCRDGWGGTSGDKVCAGPTPSACTCSLTDGEACTALLSIGQTGVFPRTIDGVTYRFYEQIGTLALTENLYQDRVTPYPCQYGTVADPDPAHVADNTAMYAPRPWPAGSTLRLWENASFDMTTGMGQHIDISHFEINMNRALGGIYHGEILLQMQLFYFSPVSSTYIAVPGVYPPDGQYLYTYPPVNSVNCYAPTTLLPQTDCNTGMYRAFLGGSPTWYLTWWDRV